MKLNIKISELCCLGRLVIDFSHIGWAFGQFPLVISLWLVMLSQSLFAFPMFQFWSQFRVGSGLGTSVVDSIGLFVYLAYVLLLFVYPILAIHNWELPLASTIVVACEQVGIVMSMTVCMRSCVRACADTSFIDLPRFGSQ